MAKIVEFENVYLEYPDVYEIEEEESQEGDDISLDTTVDEYENTVENTTKE